MCCCCWLHGGVVVSTVASQQEVFLHVLPVCAWVLSGYSGFLPPPKNIHVRLTGVSNIVPRSDCERVWLCVSVWPCDGLSTCPGCTLPLAQ